MPTLTLERADEILKQAVEDRLGQPTEYQDLEAGLRDMRAARDHALEAGAPYEALRRMTHWLRTANDILLRIQVAIRSVPAAPAVELDTAAFRAMRLYSDELGALRRLRDMALALTPYADDGQVESHFPDLADQLRSLTEVARSAGAK
jgi:hypothetical protein